MSDFEIEKIKPILEKLTSSLYDSGEDARALRAKISAEVLGNRRVKIEMKDREALAGGEVLIFVSKRGFVTDERGICKVEKLDYDNYYVIMFLNDDEKYITASCGDVYAPILNIGENEQ